MGSAGDTLFLIRLVLLVPKREAHSCRLLARRLSSNHVEHLADVVNLDLVNPCLLVTLGPAGLLSEHTVSGQLPQA